MENAEDLVNTSSVHSEANTLTLAALGIIAYVAEALSHEALGHGVICFITGGRITLLAPLYMQCSFVTPLMVAAGPGANLVFGLLSWLALQVPRKRTGAWSYFLWLCVAFNWLVAAGYLLVGAITGFGDWSVLFAAIHPDWLWRLPAGAVALAVYGGTVAILTREFTRLTDLATTSAVLGQLVLVPTGAAAVVSVGAEIYGQGVQPLGLALALGCTLVVGLSLMAMRNGSDIKTIRDGKLQIRPDWKLIAAGLLAAVGFIVVVGPGWAW